MNKTFQRPIMYILLFIICISLSTNYFKVYSLNGNYSQIALIDTDTQKTIKGRGEVVASLIGIGVLCTVGAIVYYTSDSKGNVIGTTKEYTIDLSSKYYIDDIKFVDGVSAEIAERADGLLCAQSVREHIY